MELERILDRCQRLEARAASVYRAFAAAARSHPALCALWTELAREEEQHADSIAVARDRLRLGGNSRIAIEGWSEALDEVERRLETAEALDASAPVTRQLATALDLEMTELEALRQVLLTAARSPDREHGQARHAERLAAAAEKLTDDPHVRLQVALLRTRARIEGTPGTGA